MGSFDGSQVQVGLSVEKKGDPLFFFGFTKKRLGRISSSSHLHIPFFSRTKTKKGGCPALKVTGGSKSRFFFSYFWPLNQFLRKPWYPMFIVEKNAPHPLSQWQSVSFFDGQSGRRWDVDVWFKVIQVETSRPFLWRGGGQAIDGGRCGSGNGNVDDADDVDVDVDSSTNSAVFSWVSQVMAPKLRLCASAWRPVPGFRSVAPPLPPTWRHRRQRWRWWPKVCSTVEVRLGAWNGT